MYVIEFRRHYSLEDPRDRTIVATSPTLQGALNKRELSGDLVTKDGRIVDVTLPDTPFNRYHNTAAEWQRKKVSTK